MDAQTVISLAGGIDERLGLQIQFLLELDRLKSVMRRSFLVDGSRYENTAEHSWHLAMLALTLSEHAGPDVDVARAIKIALIHDVVEIDAGDTYIYDDEARQHKAAAEEEAADRIFGLLPDDQATEFRALWDEYEQRETPTAHFAYAVDRLQPLLLNISSGGVAWSQNGIHTAQVEAVNAPIEQASEMLWSLAQEVIATATSEGALESS